MSRLPRAFAVACLALLSLFASSSLAQAPGAPQQILVMFSMPPAHFRADGNYSGGYSNTAGRAALRRVANDLAHAHGLRIVSEWPMPVIGVDCYVMDVQDSRSAAEVAQRINGQPHVAWAQPMNEFRAMGHDDPLFALQPAAREWHLAQLHEVATGRGVRVAVIDSGVQADHPDLAQQIEQRVDFATDHADAAESHGTAVAGIIAARADNHVGIAGVAPHARVLAFRACWEGADATRCRSLGLALALNAAIERGADIINLSLGGPPDALVQRLIEAAIARGTAVVAAARKELAGGGFPASVRGVIAVSDEPLPRGTAMRAAPGTDVLATLPVSRWGAVSGSSYAAAHVSGLLALLVELRSRRPLPASTLRTPLAAELAAGDDGRIDACASIARAAHSCTCACDTIAVMPSDTRR
ncbi:MAG TPA: S8 family serine peptidase [Ramlibacter sp.]|jgi:subtilisin family serine protease|nr:S8 family serine peptidase [Ramlibacter sp.]